MNNLFNKENGILRVTDKKTAAFLSFSKANSEGDIYNAVEKSIPKIKGLKLKSKRTEFTIELIDAMGKNGLVVDVRVG